MRKQLLAVIFLPGFAVFATIGSAQVLKGSQPANTKRESTLKSTKGTTATVSSGKVKRAPAALDAGSKDPARQHTGAATTSKTAVHPEALTVKQKTGIDTRTGGATAKPELGDGSVRSKARAADIAATSGALNTTHGSTLKETTKTAPIRTEAQKAKKKTVKQTTQPK